MTLTPTQLDSLESQVGPAVTQALQALVVSPKYQSLNDDDKKDAIDSLVSKIRKQVRAEADIDTPAGLESSGPSSTSPSKEGKVFQLITDSGTVQIIDLSKPIEYPTLTGYAEIDKKLVSSYKSAITSRKNDIIKLYQDGQISAEEANRLIGDLPKSGSSSGSRGGRNVTSSKITIPKITIAESKVSLPRITLGKTPRVRIVSPPKIKTLKIAKAKTPKNLTIVRKNSNLLTVKPKLQG